VLAGPTHTSADGVGGTGEDRSMDVAVDSQGAAYVTNMASSGFPTSPDAFKKVVDVSSDAFVTTLLPSNAGAASLGYSTLFGGNDSDIARCIAVDAADNVYITGDTLSSNLATQGAAQTTYIGDQTAAFAAKIASSARLDQYSYDGLQRLIGAIESPGSSYAYDYDLAGNRTAVTVNGTTTTTTYNAANQITNAGYSYDNAGNLAADDTAAYTYDALSRMSARLDDLHV